jgi:TolA-binding protein
MGEIDFRAGKYSTAIKDYDQVLDQFPNNPKVPVSHLHKGKALFETGKREAGITEMRALITRFPSSPEAAQARSTLTGMGVPVAPRRPAQ